MIYMLPGMGASREMYSGPWLELREFQFLDWPRAGASRTLRDVAQLLIQLHDIRSQDVVGGSSLGGMVALEASKILGSEQVILIGTALRPEEIHPALRRLAALSPIFPLRPAQVLADWIPSRLTCMFSKAEAGFVRDMCRSIAQWEGCSRIPSKVHRIHGSHDWLIRPSGSAQIVSGAGHLVAMSHAQECVDWLKARLIDP